LLNEKIFAVAHFVDQGILWVLILLSVISIALILERFFALHSVASGSRKVRLLLRNSLSTNQFSGVEALATDLTSLEGRAVSMALRHVKSHGEKGLEEVFNSFALNERPELERSLNFLATVGSNAPYIGLLGTVLGIMKAFQDLAQSAEAGQQTVMAGISTALVATAFGLFVAIPAVVGYNYFQRQVRSILQSLDSVKEICVAYAKSKGSV
jgi:biopolymer transport protein TolQ